MNSINLPQDILLTIYNLGDSLDKSMWKLAFTGEVSEKRRSRMCDEAAAAQYSTLLKFLVESMFPISIITYSMLAKWGNVELLEWLLDRHKAGEVNYVERDFYLPSIVAESASKEGHLDTLKWLEDNDFEFDEYAGHAAIINGHLEVVKWLFSKGFDLSKVDSTEAVRSGNLQLVEWLFEKKSIFCRNSLDVAAKHNYLGILKLLVSKGLVPTDSVFRLTSSVEVLDYLLSVSQHSSESISHAYISRGDLECVKLLWKRKRFFSTEPVQFAILFGKFEVAEWLTTKKFQLKEEYVYDAVKSGSLETVKWMRQKGYCYNEVCFSQAANMGNIPILEYLVEISCPYNKNLYEEELCREHYNIEILEWIKENRYRLNPLRLSIGRIEECKQSLQRVHYMLKGIHYMYNKVFILLSWIDKNLEYLVKEL